MPDDFRQDRDISTAHALFSNLKKHGEQSALTAAFAHLWPSAFSHGFQSAKVIYTTTPPAAQPAQPAPVPLTDEVIERALKAACMHSTPESRKDMRRAVEAAAQPAPVSNETMQKLREKLESPSYTHALAYQNIREALEIVMRWIDDYCETGPENDFEKVEKIANAALEATPPTAQTATVPLTARELELIDGMIEVQLDHAKRCDSIANRTMAERQKGWDMERVALLQKLKENT